MDPDYSDDKYVLQACIETIASHGLCNRDKMKPRRIDFSVSLFKVKY